MGFPVANTGRVDARLTNILLTQKNHKFINDMIFPKYPNIKDDTGFIARMSDDHLRSYSLQKNINDLSPNKYEWKMDDDINYNIQYFEVETDLIDRVVAQGRSPVYHKEATAMKLNQVVNLQKEKAMADIVFSQTVMSNNSTPTNKWNAGSSDPHVNIETACNDVKDNIGIRPTHAVTNDKVISALQNNAVYRDRFSHNTTRLSKQDVIDIIKADHGLEEIYVGSAREITSKEGQETKTYGDIWSKDFLLYYKSTTPMYDETLGYRFVLEDQDMRVDTRRHASDKADILRIMYAYQDKLINANAGHLIHSVLD